MTPGAASATKSNVLASGPMRPSSGIFTNSRRYSRSESSVFIVIANRFGATSVGSNSSVPTSKALAQRALGVHLAHERATAVTSRDVGERRGDRRLADATLAGDPDELEVEQRRRRRGQVQPPKPMRRSPSDEPSSM